MRLATLCLLALLLVPSTATAMSPLEEEIDGIARTCDELLKGNQGGHECIDPNIFAVYIQRAHNLPKCVRERPTNMDQALQLARAFVEAIKDRKDRCDPGVVFEQAGEPDSKVLSTSMDFRVCAINLVHQCY